MKEGPLNRLAETAPRGAKQAFKLENLARYYLTKDDLPNHEAIFQLAFMDDEVYALLDQVVKLWETQKLKGMKEPKLRKKPSSATEKGQAFLAKPTLTCSYLKELPSLQSDQQLVVLRSVIRGDDSLQSMSQKVKVMKEMHGRCENVLRESCGTSEVDGRAEEVSRKDYRCGIGGSPHVYFNVHEEDKDEDQAG